MLENAISRRYASALFDLAQEQGKIEDFEKELEAVIKAIDASPELEAVLDNQLMEAHIKKDVVHQVFTGQVSDTTVDFLKVVLDKHREMYLKDIYNYFVAAANESRNLRDAEVVSARELTEADLAEVKAKLEKMTGKTIRLTSKVDQSIIGGLVVRIGDKIIDGSVTKRLELLKETLLQG